MSSQRAADLMRTLQSLAAQRGIDLVAAGNRWTLWLRPTARALPDKLPAVRYKFEFMAGGVSLAELFARVEQEHSYMLATFDGALIVEARTLDQFVLREFSCSEGEVCATTGDSINVTDFSGDVPARPARG